jgi:hypothetical protein
MGGEQRTIRPMTACRGRIVLILGMHRSGTSMLARLLAALGLPLGGGLLTHRAQDNHHGYWEQGEIVAIHEALLDGHDRTWRGPNGLRPMPEGWLDGEAARTAKTRLAAIAGREVAQAGGLWGFKDPRTLRFLPLWRAITAELGLAPVYVLGARAPAAVADSLMQRNRLSRDFAEALWAFNMLEVLDEVGPELTAVVDYDAWFVPHPEAIAEHLGAALGLPRREPGVPAPIKALIEPALRHHRGKAGTALPAFQALHRAMVAAAPRPPAMTAMAGPMQAAALALQSWS